MPFDPFGDYESHGYLRNRLRERDVSNLRKLEHVGFSGRVVDALSYLSGERYLGYEQLLRVHEMLFAFLYPWAGEDRAVTAPNLNIGKASYKDIFARPSEIRRAFEYAIALDDEELAARPGSAFTRLAFAHPFLDMNGRTILTFHAAMLRRVRKYVRWDRIEESAFLVALTADLQEEGDALDRLIHTEVYDGRRQAKTLARYIDDTTRRRLR